MQHCCTDTTAKPSQPESISRGQNDRACLNMEVRGISCRQQCAPHQVLPWIAPPYGAPLKGFSWSVPHEWPAPPSEHSSEWIYPHLSVWRTLGLQLCWQCSDFLRQHWPVLVPPQPSEGHPCHLHLLFPQPSGHGQSAHSSLSSKSVNPWQQVFKCTKRWGLGGPVYGRKLATRSGAV